MASTFISLPVTNTAITGPIDVNISASNDSIKISDGTDTLAVNADGSLNIAGTISGEVDAVYVGLNEYEYNEVLSIASGATVTVVSHFFATNYKLRKVNCSGSNIAVWVVNIDGNPIDKRRSNYTDLNCDFEYETGISVNAGSTVTVEVTNSGTSIGDFSARLLFSPK